MFLISGIHYQPSMNLVKPKRPCSKSFQVYYKHWMACLRFCQYLSANMTTDYLKTISTLEIRDGHFPNSERLNWRGGWLFLPTTSVHNTSLQPGHRNANLFDKQKTSTVTNQSPAYPNEEHDFKVHDGNRTCWEAYVSHNPRWYISSLDFDLLSENRQKKQTEVALIGPFISCTRPL
jgi:hypothetical protein